MLARQRISENVSENQHKEGDFLFASWSRDSILRPLFLFNVNTPKHL